VNCNIHKGVLVQTNTKHSRHLLFNRLLIALFCLALATMLILAGTPGLGAQRAYAVTSAEKQAEVDAALSRLDAIQTELNQIANDYAAAELAHADAEARMLDAKAREEAAEARIVELQQQLGNRAQQMYRNGQISFLDVLFGAESFTDFITAIDLMNRVNSADAKLTLETKEVRAAAEAAKIEYTEQERIAREKQDQLGALKVEKVRASENMAAEIESLKEEAAELLAQEKLAAEAAARAAAAGGSSSAGTVTEAQMAKVAALGLQYPIGVVNVSSGFGPRWGTFHKGTDFAAPSGTPILAAAAGTVTSANGGGGWNGGMGNFVIINHGDGIRTVYMHASSVSAKLGQVVSAGDVIAGVGTTGDSTGNHLHFQVEVDGIAVNPMLFL
jgi:murein DD-endopeptidase MepM/ murein hydrolase activator NlpD